MTDAQEKTEPSGSAVRAVAFGALSVYAVLCVAFWAQPAWRPEWDSAIYMLTARAMAAGEGYSYQGSPFFLRPPGFSWFLSWLPWTSSLDWAALNRTIQAFAAAAVVAVFFAFRSRGPWRALGIALLFGTSPLYVQSFNWVLSEMPFLALLYVAFALLHRPRHRDADPSSAREATVRAIAAAVCLAAAAYLRTAALLALPAALLSLVRPGGRHRLQTALPLVAAGLALVPWFAHSAAVRTEATRPSEQLLLFDYRTALLHTDPGDPDSPRVTPAGFAERARENAELLFHHGTLALVHRDWPVAGALFLLLILAGAVRSALRGDGLLELFAAAYGTLILLYFTVAGRLLLPVLPLLYAYGLFGAEWIGGLAARRAAGGARVRAVLPMVLFGLLFASNLAAFPRNADALEFGAADRLAERFADIESVSAWIRENTPEEAVILCNRAPTLGLLTGRATYTYRFLRSPGLLERTGADYLVLDARYPSDLQRQAEARNLQRWVLPSRLPGERVLVYRLP